MVLIYHIRKQYYTPAGASAAPGLPVQGTKELDNQSQPFKEINTDICLTTYTSWTHCVKPQVQRTQLVNL